MTVSILDYREKCMSVLHIVKTDLKRLREYSQKHSLDFSSQIAEMENLKNKIEEKIAEHDNLNRLVTKATSEMDMGIKLAQDKLVELGNMKGVAR